MQAEWRNAGRLWDREFGVVDNTKLRFRMRDVRGAYDRAGSSWNFGWRVEYVRATSLSQLPLSCREIALWRKLLSRIATFLPIKRGSCSSRCTKAQQEQFTVNRILSRATQSRQRDKARRFYFVGSTPRAGGLGNDRIEALPLVEVA